MRKIFNIILMILSLLTFLDAQVKTAKIAYISSQKVYLNAGKAAGLESGDTLRVFRGSSYIGAVKVEYVATHSASCQIVDKKTEFRKNDSVRLPVHTVARQKPQKTKKSTQKAVQKKRVTQAENPKKILTTRVRGYISGQYYHFSDGNKKGYTFSQPALRFRLRIDDFWREGFHFEINYRTRYNHRQRRLSGGIPKTEWQHRLYQFNFSYRLPGAPFQFRVGRVISNALSGVGYIDGALLQWQTAKNWFIGGFGGTQPDWRTSDWQTEIQKYGMYVRYEKGDFSENRTAITIAASGEYHGRIVSREFLFFRGSYNHGRRWNVYQQTELDINRDWRKLRMGNSLSLTGMYMNGRYNFTRNTSVSIGYDNRRNYYSYETRTIADSLFDNAVRQGIRFSGYTRLFKDYRLAVFFGLRDRQTDARLSYNYGFNMSKRRFFGIGNVLFLSMSGFDNLFANGINPSMRLSRRFRNNLYLSLNYGNYFYQFKNSAGSRLNQWLRLSTQLELPVRLYASFNYTYDWGSDIQGQRIFLELGRRF